MNSNDEIRSRRDRVSKYVHQMWGFIKSLIRLGRYLNEVEFLKSGEFFGSGHPDSSNRANSSDQGTNQMYSKP